jgi:hypothetical protein
MPWLTIRDRFGNSWETIAPNGDYELISIDRTTPVSPQSVDKERAP